MILPDGSYARRTPLLSASAYPSRELTFKSRGQPSMSAEWRRNEMQQQQQRSSDRRMYGADESLACSNSDPKTSEPQALLEYDPCMGFYFRPISQCMMESPPPPCSTEVATTGWDQRQPDQRLSYISSSAVNDSPCNDLLQPPPMRSRSRSRRMRYLPEEGAVVVEHHHHSSIRIIVAVILIFLALAIAGGVFAYFAVKRNRNQT